MKLLTAAAIVGTAGLMISQSAYACGCGCKAAPAKAAAVKAAVQDHAHGDHGYKVVDTEAVEKAVSEKAVIVDARGGKWLDGRRIPGAKVVSAGSSAEDIAKALPDKDAKIVAYCTNTKCPASEKLAHQLVDLGYTNVEKYPGGIDAWEKAGKTVEKASE